MHTQFIRLALIAYALIVAVVYGDKDNNIRRPRGVSLAKAALYQPQSDGSWSCLDGSKRIPFVQINDDYCDCADGSDEPGTAACVQMRFHCINQGHQPLDIYSSHVQDGICDCCDGSDELPAVGCANTCLELGAAAAIQRRSEAELHKRGAERRQEMITRGKQLKADRVARRSELQARIKEQESLKAEKEQLKTNAEALETEALEVYREQQRELDANTAQAEQEPQQMRHEASLSFVRFDANKDGFVEITELMIDMDLDKDRNGVVTVEEAKYFLDERERVDLDAFVTLAWPRIKPLKMLADGLFQPPQTEEQAATEAPLANEQQEAQLEIDPPTNEHEDLEDEEEHYDDEEDEEEEPDVGVGEALPEFEATTETTTTTPNYDPETQRLIEQANGARQALEEVERQLREIEHEVKEIEEQDAKDYGVNEEWAMLDGECYTFEDREYVYTLCPFDRVSQKPKNGGAETTLGRWDQWFGEGDNKYTRQKYAQGAACWNGPQRSALVNIRCAVEPKITAVSEPNRCEYSYDFETPAACDSDALAATARAHDEL
ncbi:GH10155 [Drosophila grimshawi]|uniref:Glucosidase 2 subunit beta n=2 Tax=Drosophila grimshawi TaxID=7222 RepID=B4JC86_DROGR|nr:GH10155 [Drosophila grimshawi]